MTEPEPSPTLPKYLAKGIPEQDVDTLHDIRNYSMLNAAAT
jgi:hypothetical protein